MNKAGIYAIVNNVNGKRYVGQTINLYKRWREHRNALRRGDHDNSYLQRAWQKYGESAFDFVVLETARIEVLTEREQYWMDHYGKPYLYNIGLSAKNPMLGRKHTAETKRKIVQNRKWDDETRAKISAARTGIKASPETRAKLSALHMCEHGETHRNKYRRCIICHNRRCREYHAAGRYRRTPSKVGQ